MQLPWDEHFAQIVMPAWQSYLASEVQLTNAVNSEDEGHIRSAKYTALREGGAAVFYVHHFADVVWRAQPGWMPSSIKNLKGLREWLEKHCMMLRTSNNVTDVSLLGDVADALKHAILTQRLNMRDISQNDAVLVAGRGYGEGRYGEGKFGGMDQVLILANSGTRCLSSVLQNVIDAWRRAAGFSLPEIGSP